MKIIVLVYQYDILVAEQEFSSWGDVIDYCRHLNLEYQVVLK